MFAQEFGSIWLARDPEGTDHGGTQVQDTDSIYARIDQPLAIEPIEAFATTESDDSGETTDE